MCGQAAPGGMRRRRRQWVDKEIGDGGKSMSSDDSIGMASGDEDWSDRQPSGEDGKAMGRKVPLRTVREAWFFSRI